MAYGYLVVVPVVPIAMFVVVDLEAIAPDDFVAIVIGGFETEVDLVAVADFVVA